MSEGDIHRQFSDGRVQLAYGLGQDGRLRHISEVSSGLACDCVCPACQTRLIARLPREIAPHFSHLGGAACASGPETALHFLAKEALEAHKRLLVPAVEAASGKVREVTYQTREMSFDRVEVERRLDGVTPDIIVYHGDRQLVVEIHVTHASGLEKVERLRAMTLPAVEIDLSGISRSASRDEIADAVISGAPRKWLYNAKVDAAQQRVDDKVAAAKLVADRKLDKEARAFIDRYNALLDKPFADASALAKSIQLVSDLGFGEYVSFPIAEEHVFRTAPRDWQSMIFKQYVINADWIWNRFSDSDATHYLFSCKIIDELFRQPLRRELSERLSRIRPDFAMPQRIVGAYLQFLAQQGILSQYEGTWSASSTASNAVKAAKDVIARREQELAEAERRLDGLTRRVEGLLAHLHEPMRPEFQLAAWLDAHQGDFGGSPADLAKAGGTDWNRFAAALKSVENALRLDGDLPPLLGLPVLPCIQAAAQTRVEEREQARLAAEAKEKIAQCNREALFAKEARLTLGADAEAWIDGCYQAGAKARRVLCRISDDNLDWFINELERERRRRDDEDRKRVEAIRIRDQFMDKAVSTLGQQHAELLLRNFSPKLNARPIDILVDPTGLARCLSLLPHKRSGPR